MSDEADRVAFLLSSCSSTTPVDKDLMIAWIVVMYDIVDLRDIESSSSNISDNQDRALLLSKAIQGIGPLVHVHLSINSVAVIQLTHQGKQIVHMETSRNEDNHLLFLYNVAQKVKQCSCLFFRPNHKEIYLHGLRKCDFLMDIAVVP